MIPRYSRKNMASLWSDETRFGLWLEIECHALDAMANMGLLPKKAAQAVRKKARFDVKRIEALEADLKHDVLAFLTNVSEHVGDEARFLHQGLTSSDILDTALSLQLKKAADILIKDLAELQKALLKRAKEHKKTLCIGRSHGIHAEPTSFGLKLLQAYAEFGRQKDRLLAAREEIAICALSGPVGTFASVPPQIEAHVARKMNLKIEPISTQVIPRDRHAMFFATLAVLAGSLERFATEIRHLQRTEVLEAEEPFGEKQKGSSAMPHKRNPILSENLTGLARLIRAFALPALENIALWHERDISHSSAERVIAPDATILMDFALHRLSNIVREMVVYPKTMAANLESSGGLVYSHAVLLALTQKGMARESAYKLVQTHAMAAQKGGATFSDRLAKDSDIRAHLSDKEIRALFDPAHYLRHADEIFARVLKKTAPKKKP